MKMTNVGNVTRLRVGGLTVEGFAISALASYIMVPELKVVFDLGHCPIEALPYTVFLSHTHCDHVAGVPHYFSLREMMGLKGAAVYCPRSSASDLSIMLKNFDGMEDKVPQNRNIIDVGAGEEFTFGRHQVRVMDVSHRITSVGYTFIERKKKLLPEFVGSSPDTIAAARKSGVTVDGVVNRQVLTYIGDSTIDTLVHHPDVGQSEVLLIESTHMGDFSPEESARMGHTHLDQLVDLWGKDPNGALAAKNIVLKHFSLRYKDHQIREYVSDLPEDLRSRISLLL